MSRTDGGPLISVDEAIKIIMAAALPPSAVEEVPLDEAAGRVLARDEEADLNAPPFDKAMMDGYAVRSADGAGPRRVVEVLAAGRMPQKRIGPEECAQINTGAPLPEGADAVQMVEKTRPAADGGVDILEAPKTGEHVAPRARYFAKGQIVLARGSVVTPEVAAVLASIGAARVLVYAKPRVSLISTGSELVPVEHKPGPGQIRNTNRHSLAAQLHGLGLKAEFRGTLGDDRAATLKAVAESLAHCDVLFLTGGVSMGSFDFVHEILPRAGVAIKFRKVAVKPGKPFVFGTFGEGGMVFSLPGNPVSGAVLFYLFARPALRKRLGLPQWENLRFLASLQGDITVKADDKTKYEPAALSVAQGCWRVHPVPIHGSEDMLGFSRANALVEVPAGNTGYRAGQDVPVLPMQRVP